MKYRAKHATNKAKKVPGLDETIAPNQRISARESNGSYAASDFIIDNRISPERIVVTTPDEGQTVITEFPDGSFHVRHKWPTFNLALANEKTLIEILRLL